MEKLFSNISVKKLNLLITLLLISQVWYINYVEIPKEMQLDSLLILKRENYVTNLENKFEKLIQSDMYNKLKTSILFTKDTKIEVAFIWNEKDKEKYKSELTNSEQFDSNIFINLYYYHKNYINELFRHTDNSMIWESFEFMIKTIEKINNQYPNLGSQEDINNFKETSKSFIDYLKDMNTSRAEMIKFDKKIEELYGIEPYKYKVNELDMQGELKKIELLLEMFNNTNYLFINMPKNTLEDPFLKFNTFVNIYDTTYKLYKSYTQKYNNRIEEKNKLNKLILSLFSILIIILTFWKDRDINTQNPATV